MSQGQLIYDFNKLHEDTGKERKEEKKPKPTFNKEKEIVIKNGKHPIKDKKEKKIPGIQEEKETNGVSEIQKVKTSGMEEEEEIDEESLTYALKQSFNELCEAVSELQKLNLNSPFRLIVETDSVYDTSQKFIMYYNNSESKADDIKYNKDKLYYDFNHGFSITKENADSLADFVLGENNIFVFVHEFFEVFDDFNDYYLESNEDIKKPEYIKINIKINISGTDIVSSLELEPSNGYSGEFMGESKDDFHIIVENEIFFIKPFIILYLIKFFDLNEEEYIDYINYININDKEELKEYLINNGCYYKYDCDKYYTYIINFINEGLYSNYNKIFINGASIEDYIKRFEPQKTIEIPLKFPLYTGINPQVDQTISSDDFAIRHRLKGGNKNKQVKIINKLYCKNE